MIHEFQTPGEMLRSQLKVRGWTQKQLALVIGKPTQLINEVAKNKRAISAETAQLLAAAFGNSPENWLHSQAQHELLNCPIATDIVAQRAKLFQIAPIKKMQTRGWISKTENIEELTDELCRFYGHSILDGDIQLSGATRRSAEDGSALTPEQSAWCLKVREIAATQQVCEYEDHMADFAIRLVRRIAGSAEDIHLVSRALNSNGIRFVVVEPLKGCRCDGFATWIDGAPVIGLSLQYDRIDSFFFTLLHELSHIKHRDSAPLDVDLRGHAMLPLSVKPDIERRADSDAADWLIPKEEMDSFVKRVGPLYSKQKILGFARRMKVHEGIVVGQLQYRGEIGYSANREMLIKIRGKVASSCQSDGY